MKKIIAAFDGLKYSESAALYAIEIAKLHGAKIFGVFLEDFTYHSYSITDLAADDYPEAHAAQLNRMDAETRENSTHHFAQQCEERGVSYSIHRDKNIAIVELMHESRFADLVIIQNNETLNHYAENAPSRFVDDLLQKTECPVFIVPDLFEKPEKVVFLYDGQPSSMYAIKQFSYLFPARNMPAELLYVEEKGLNERMPDAHSVKEWLNLYYSPIQYTFRKGNAHEEILSFLKEEVASCIAVLGAYERGSISRIIHRSLADVLMKEMNLPLFIAHR